MGRATETNQHSMASTWTTADKSTWNRAQKTMHFLNAYPVLPGQPLPVRKKTEKIPYMVAWSQHLYIIVYAAVPFIIHQAYTSLTGHSLGKIATFVLYTFSYMFNAARESRMLRQLAYKYGCLDGDEYDRDGIPDGYGAGKILGELSKTSAIRLALAVWATYDPTSSPMTAFSDPKWWMLLAAKLCLYGVVLDFFFYTYHRACHEVPNLWKYHRTHHLAKHPTVLHSGWADDEQEIIEILIVPLLTFGSLWAMGLPLGFYDWWICFEYVTYAEVWGHSGIRVHGIVPSPISWLLQLLDMELALEDHDLHHRKGWKKSFNYGKQTRVWDRLFGTTTSRLEAVASNIDYSQLVQMPLR
ncbi:hypothetical protein VHEMI04672 [[Torrubiella] hemipterigena]|uniref:Fatty acid hydroxylase domain-containing protein n=1 Tax=[Torrubiella] hemipterigena TaxID=1531966 RepID=A0A0A1SVX8_9HYPO|nr:hypothetical protein VHEMI04672 [[Torrubiella] hemipterigena]